MEIISNKRDFVVVYKPASMPSQSDPSGDKDAMTATGELLEKMGENKELFLIHRLDRVVGGLLVFAKNKKSAAGLSEAISSGKFEKRYFAVVEGEPGDGRYEDLLFKDARAGKSFIVERMRGGVKEAVLEYNTVATVATEQGSRSLVAVRLITGRFHQIRAQFSYHGFPLVGDKKYGAKDGGAKFPALFAARLSFKLNGNKFSFGINPDTEEYPWSLFESKYYGEDKT